MVPSEALFVEYSESVISWAAQVGAHGVLVDSHGTKQAPPNVPTLSSLAELPGVIDSLP